MASSQFALAVADGVRRKALTADTVATIVLQSAWRALVRAFLIQLLAGIAISLLSSLFGEMTPSLPPGLGHASQSIAAHSAIVHSLQKFVFHNRLWVLATLLFVAICTGEFIRFVHRPKHRRMAARWLRLTRRVSRGWFRLFVGNAFVAWVSVILLVLLQHFSLPHLLWNAACVVLQPIFHGLASVIPGAGWLGRWYSWYAQNQAKFVFWLLYSAAICDDLGLPNYKSVFLWARRRLKEGFWAAFRLMPQRA